MHVEDLFTPEELKTLPTHNEMLLRTGGQNSMNPRLDGPDGSSITWGLRDPVGAGWRRSRSRWSRAYYPMRQFVRVRQAVVRAEARNTTVTTLLDNPRIGVFHLYRRGRIIKANGRARSIPRHGDGLADRVGTLRADAAWPRSPVLPPFVMHIKPVSVPQPDLVAPVQFPALPA